MNINKDTLLFGSFTTKPGNNGCKFFNSGFQYYGINAIYKSFGISNIENAVKAAKTLGFSGFSVSQPFKEEVLQFVDMLSTEVQHIKAANTIVKTPSDLWVAHNTDYIAAQTYLSNYPHQLTVYILGDGGYSKAVRYACEKNDRSYRVITRKNWDLIGSIEHSIIYNCTPVENIKCNPSNVFINSVPTTKTGIALSLLQASKQFEIYTGYKFSVQL